MKFLVRVQREIAIPNRLAMNATCSMLSPFSALRSCQDFAHLLQYGSCSAYDDWLAKEQMEATSFALTLGRLGHESWRQVRTQWRQEQSDQLKMYHFRYKHERFLQALENRWATAIICMGQVH